MKKQWLISAAVMALLSTGAMAAGDPAADPAKGAAAAPASPSGAPENTTPASTNSYQGGRYEFHEWTLEEARKHAHERADKLDHMSEADYAAEREKYKEERKQRWMSMTPEQRDAIKAAHKAKKDAAPAEPAKASPSAGK